MNSKTPVLFCKNSDQILYLTNYLISAVELIRWAIQPAAHVLHIGRGPDNVAGALQGGSHPHEGAGCQGALLVLSSWHWHVHLSVSVLKYSKIWNCSERSASKATLPLASKATINGVILSFCRFPFSYARRGCFHQILASEHQNFKILVSSPMNYGGYAQEFWRSNTSKLSIFSETPFAGNKQNIRVYSNSIEFNLKWKHPQWKMYNPI